MNWMGENWIEVLAVLGGLHAIAKVVVGWTETKTDDKILQQVERVFRLIGLQPKSKG